MTQDTREFTQLLSPHYNNALKYARALCSSWAPDEAEDVLQQSFLKALENFNSLKDKEKFKSWFFKIITREFYSSIRKHFWKKFLPIDENETIQNIPDVFSRTDSNEDSHILYEALSKLSSKERSAVLLFEIAGFSIEEITEIQCEKSQSAVKSRLSRSRKKLKKILTEPVKQPKLYTNSIFKGDLEYETIKLISEIRTER